MDRKTPDGLSIPEDIVEPLYTAVGQLVVNWALMEQALESWVAVIYHQAGGKLVTPKLSKRLGDKISLLRRWLVEIDQLAPFSPEGVTLLDRIEALGKTRNHIVHGAISEFEPSSLTLTFIKIDTDKCRSMQRANSLRITAAELLSAGTEAMDLASDVVDFGSTLSKSV